MPLKRFIIESTLFTFDAADFTIIEQIPSKMHSTVNLDYEDLAGVILDIKQEKVTLSVLLKQDIQNSIDYSFDIFETSPEKELLEVYKFLQNQIINK